MRCVEKRNDISLPFIWSQFFALSLLSLLETIAQTVGAPFKTAADKVEGFFASLGADIQNAEQEILNEIEQDFVKDAGPLIQGISSLFPISLAEKIISNPLDVSNLRHNLPNSYKQIVESSIDSIVLQAPESGGAEAATLTITPTLSLQAIGQNNNFSYFAGSLPNIDGNSLTGGFRYNLILTSSPSLNIGLGLNIDIPGNGTFELPSFGLNAGSNKKNLGGFQSSDGIASISAGIGYGGSITNNTNDPIILDLDISFLLTSSLFIEPVITEKFNLDAADIKNYYARVCQGDLLSKNFWKEESPIAPKYYDYFGGGVTSSVTPTFKVTRNGLPAEIDALTGLEVDLNINPQVNGSVGLIFKEEDTGITLTAVNFPLTLANKISLGVDENDKVQLTDAISLDAGVNIQAFGATLYNSLSMPGFVWDLGSLEESLGTFDLLHPNANGFLYLGNPRFEPSGVLTFDGIELASANF